jgi:hypothetical protein
MDKARRGQPERHERTGDGAGRRSGKLPAPDKRPHPSKASVIVFPAEG